MGCIINKKWLVVITVVLFLASISFAATGDAGDAAAFLRTGVGARALALSGAFTAYYDDSTCAYWNPAATAYLKDISVSTMFSLLTAQRDYNYFNPYPLYQIQKDDEKVLKVLYNKANKGFRTIKRRTPNG